MKIEKEIKFYVEGDRDYWSVYADLHFDDIVEIADILWEAGRTVFGEESYLDYLEDLAYFCEEEGIQWRYWLPEKPPERQEARKIYEKRREQIKLFARMLRDYLRNGYVIAKLRRMSDEEFRRFKKARMLRVLPEEQKYKVRWEDGSTVLIKGTFHDPWSGWWTFKDLPV